ncbi:MAG: hypothetical protein ABSB74_00575 [Tepidisphaeraceae bacterium]
MSENTPRKIVCTACGRTARYRPELAGKQVKCKCGHIISVPKHPAEAHGAGDLSEPLRPEPLAAEGASDELYEIREEPKPTKPRGVAAPVAAQSPATSDSPLPRAPAPGMYQTSSRPKIPDSGQEKSGLLRLVMVVGILAAMIVGAVVGIKKFGGPRHAAGPQLGEDADIEEKIHDEYSKDVRAWFQEDHSRILGPWSETQALGQADRWQHQGAKRVLAFGARLSMIVVIELPDDPAGRKQIFDWQADWHSRHMQKVWTDVGQKYLMIRLGV